MNTKNNIDDLLKQEFDNFAPDAPDVWGGIEQAVQTSSVTATTGAVKTGLLSGKIITAVAGIAIAAGAFVSYYYYTASSTAEPVVIAEKQLPPLPPVEQKEAPVISSNPSEIAAENNPHDIKEKAEAAPKVHSEKKKAAVIPADKTQETPRVVQKEGKEKANNEIITQPVVETQEKVAKTEGQVVANHPAQQTRNEVHTSLPENGKVEQVKTEPGKTEHKGPLDATDREFYKPRIPGSFSPDGTDQFNENFVIEIENEASFRLLILDRNGKIVFESDSKEKTWNGRNMKNGEECPKGWYFYTLRYRLNGQDESEQVSGKFCLFR